MEYSAIVDAKNDGGLLEFPEDLFSNQEDDDVDGTLVVSPLLRAELISPGMEEEEDTSVSTTTTTPAEMASQICSSPDDVDESIVKFENKKQRNRRFAAESRERKKKHFENLLRDNRTLKAKIAKYKAKFGDLSSLSSENGGNSEDKLSKVTTITTISLPASKVRKVNNNKKKSSVKIPNVDVRSGILSSNLTASASLGLFAATLICFDLDETEFVGSNSTNFHPPVAAFWAILLEISAGDILLAACISLSILSTAAALLNVKDSWWNKIRRSGSSSSFRASSSSSNSTHHPIDGLLMKSHIELYPL